MKKLLTYLLFFSSISCAKNSYTLYPTLPNTDLFILIAKHFKNHNVATPELKQEIQNATTDEKTTQDWIGIISNDKSYPSKGHTPITYLAAYTHNINRRR